ncbi:MAG: ribonuclease III [Clostridia bacterium]|nr:ribonuclease III [Clostridia bacterium]
MDCIPVIPDTITTKQARELNPLVLAFVGDSVQTLYVRTHLAVTSTAKSGALHNIAAGQISAKAQAKSADRAISVFNEDEADIYRRARNNHTLHGAKNASIADYKKASGLEAVLGYLYLTGQKQRLETILALTETAE